MPNMCKTVILQGFCDKIVLQKSFDWVGFVRQKTRDYDSNKEAIIKSVAERITRVRCIYMLNLTPEQEYEIYLKVRRELDRKWRAKKRTEESKAKKREYMREYMKKYRANA